MAQRYRRPPITEAVIELRFEPQLPVEELRSQLERFTGHYPAPIQAGFAVQVQVAPEGEPPKLAQHVQSYRLTSADGADVLILAPNSIVTSRFAPYEGWEPFCARAETNWAAWRRTFGGRRVARIGVRYINRLDIPTPTDEPVHLATYLTTFFVRPQIDGLPPNPMADFSLSCTIPLGVDQLKLVLNVASIPSPLVKTTSFVLDLDVSREVDVPQREDVIWEIINRIRGIKNLVFESSITDAARALFTQ